MEKITCLGGGAWGFALLSILQKHSIPLWLWVRSKEKSAYLTTKRTHPKYPLFPLAPHIKITDSLSQALAGSSYVVEALTTQGFVEQLPHIMVQIQKDIPLLLTSKGLLPEDGSLVPDYIAKQYGRERLKQLACLSGPTLAFEILQQKKSQAMIAAPQKEVLQQTLSLFSTSFLHLTCSTDICSVLFSGAIKNVFAIVMGVLDGLQEGMNMKAAIFTEAWQECLQLMQAQGYHTKALDLPSGIGDLYLTCSSPLSRNYSLGRFLGEGDPLPLAKKKIGMAAEGISTVVALYHLTQRLSLDLPLISFTYSLIHSQKPAKMLLHQLWSTLKEPS